MNDHPNVGGQIPPTSPPDGQEGKKVGFPKPPLFTSDYITMAEILQFAMERFGQLVLALMYYTTDGTTPDDLPPDINMMFGIYQRKVDAAREKYKKKCATNAENGSKGGKKKAENSKKKTTVAKFTPLRKNSSGTLCSTLLMKMNYQRTSPTMTQIHFLMI